MLSFNSDTSAYQGCFKDDQVRDMENWSIDGDTKLTIDKCYERCLQTNYNFMGVQVRLYLFLIFIFKIIDNLRNIAEWKLP